MEIACKSRSLELLGGQVSTSLSRLLAKSTVTFGEVGLVTAKDGEDTITVLFAKDPKTQGYLPAIVEEKFINERKK